MDVLPGHNGRIGHPDHTHFIGQNPAARGAHRLATGVADTGAFCGYCEVACPFDAITMGQDYEMSDYNSSDLIFSKEMLLDEPLERTPLRNEGE